VVLLAALGGLIVMQLLHDPVRPIPPEHPPLVVQVVDRPELERFAAATWAAAGEVRALDRAIPPGNPLGTATELELVLAPEQWPALRQTLAEGGLAGVLPESAPPPTEGRVRVLVQLGRRIPTKP